MKLPKSPAIDVLLAQMTNDKYDISTIKLQIPAQLIERGSTIAKSTV